MYVGTLPLLFSFSQNTISFIDAFAESIHDVKIKEQIFFQVDSKMWCQNFLENKQPLQADWSEYLYFCIIQENPIMALDTENIPSVQGRDSS